MDRAAMAAAEEEEEEDDDEQRDSENKIIKYNLESSILESKNVDSFVEVVFGIYLSTTWGNLGYGILVLPM